MMTNFQQQPGRSGRLIGIVIVLFVVGFVAVLLAVIAAVTNVADSQFPRNQTQAVPGDPAHFDPVTALTAVHTFAGANSQLISIESRYVRSDGTMDLTATNYHPETDYVFVLPAAAPDSAPPPGAGGGQQWYQEIDIQAYLVGQGIHVSSSYDYAYTNLGMDRRDEGTHARLPDPIVPDPQCTFAKLWSTALERGGHSDAVATIKYDYTGYSFDISGTSSDVHLTFGTDCKLGGDSFSPPTAASG